ncbi:MAG: ROK family protein [Francisellaceae bacterium]
MNKNIWCVDLGGTNIKYGVVTTQGVILMQNQIPTGHISSGEAILEKLEAIYKKDAESHAIDAIGIAAHGVVENGKISCGSQHVAALVDYPLAGEFSRLTGVSVVMENDVNAAAIGELWQGALKPYKNAVFVTLGTSIGGAIIIDGKPYHGLHHGAGEVGYLIIDQTNRDANALVPGAWEQHASASSLMRNFRRVKRNDKLNVEDLIYAFSQDDLETLHVIDEFIYALCSGLVSITHMLAPEVIVIGGALISVGDMLLNPVREQFQRRVLPIGRDTEILLAHHPKAAGLLGMAKLAS